MSTRWMLAGVVVLALATSARASPVLERVKAAGALACGVLAVPEDFGKADVHGSLDGFGADLCRAVATAVAGEAGRVKIQAYPDERHGFDAVVAGSIDLLFGASPTASAEIAHGLRFGRPVFFDAEGLLVRCDGGIASFADLAGKSACLIGSTRAEDVLDSEVFKRGVKVLPFPFEEDGEMNVALLRNHCDAIVSSVSRLAHTRSGIHGVVDEFVVLPDRLSVEPMPPASGGPTPQCCEPPRIPCCACSVGWCRPSTRR